MTAPIDALPATDAPVAAFAPLGSRERALRFLLLFAIAVVPLAFVATPPLQDVPNHLATLAVMKNPELYPEFVVSGFFKTNALFFAWMFAVSSFAGVFGAVKLFVVLIAAAGATRRLRPSA